MTEILAELPAEDPAMALEELTHWLTALAKAEDIKLKERVKRLARIDQSAQKYERALRRQYVESSRMHKAIEERIWNASFDFLETTVDAHLRCIAHLPQKNEVNDQYLAIVIMRALRRMDLQAHWLYLRYRPLPQSFWEQFYSAIKLAEARSLLHLPVTLNSIAKARTTVAQEMLKLLMMSVAAPERLTKIQIDLARLLAHNLAETFRWEHIPDGSTVFHADFSGSEIPTRLAHTAEHPFMSRCFGSGEAVRALIAGLKQLERGGVPSTLGAIDYSTYPREDLLEVMTHLAQRWSRLQAGDEPQHFDKRHDERKQVFYRVSVVHKFSALYEQLAQPALAVDKTADETETWVVENISQMGYGVTLSSVKEDWVRTHTVIGIQPDAAAWKIGVIRHMASDSVENTQLGIQILSNQADAAMLRPADTETYRHTPGILMHREPPYQEDETLLLAADSYQLHRTYEMLVGQENRAIRLLDRLHAFQGVDQIVFTEVKEKA